ncbi:MAG: Stp1/IreP family PP2C-type Ser/Thr phosphatase [Burkholderiales bacterium]|nr:Stp1/IreP family PP2C-type Ser/Thr phosphatase [Burkholderiales bacterium]
MANKRVLEFAALTDTGLVRAHNEDAMLVCADYGCAVLADGMGGYQAGEVASAMAVEIIAQYLCLKMDAAWLPAFSLWPRNLARWMVEAVELANRRVLQAAQTESDYFGMGTTVVVACCVQDKLLLAHVGDSRAYRYRDACLTRITTDHSVLQEQIDAGHISEQEARFSSIKNLITRAVGSQEMLEVELHAHSMRQGDIYLMCSDGLTDMLNHDEIQTILHLHSSDLSACCRALIASANRHGGMDNITVILFKPTH